MSVRQIARKDFEDAIRSKMLWATSTLLVLMLGLLVFLASNGDAADQPAVADIIPIFSLPLVLLVPIMSLVAGYASIIGERRSGSIKLLLGLPFSRLEVLIGKLLGRAGVISTSVLAGFAVGLGLLVVLLGLPSIDRILLFVGATLLLGAAFVSIAIGISAIASTRNRAIGLAVGIYILTTFLWYGVTALVHYVIAGGMPGLGPGSDPNIPAWYLFARYLSPTTAYARGISGLFDSTIPVIFQLPIDQLPRGGAPESVLTDVPFYLQEWFMPIILLAWIVVPTVLGYLRFRNADLG